MSAAFAGGRVKVAHILTRLDLGGAQQNTLHTVSHLDSRFEPLLLCGRGGVLDEEARALDARGAVRVSWVEDLVREVSPLRDLCALFQLVTALLRERPMIVHTHSSKAGVLGRLAARLTGVPIILHTFHGFGFHDRQHPLARGAYLALEKACAAFSTRLIFVSRANMSYAESSGLGDPSLAVLIRSGVKLSDFPAPGIRPEEVKASLGTGMHKPLVLSVGNLKPQKNAGDFLDAARKALAEVPHARFVFIGEGPLRASLEARAMAEGLSGKVLFPGWRRDVPRLLAAADVFVLTSLWEGLPRSLVEAMKTGLPSVCYDTDGVRDILRDGENGFLIPQGDSQALARAVVRLLRGEDLRKRLGRAAADSIGPEFDIDGMVLSQEKLYGDLLMSFAGPGTRGIGR